MAMTYLEDQKKKQQELQNPQQQTTQPGAYNVQGMSDTTQQQLQKSQAGYQPNEAVQTAQQNMQNVQNMRPQTYNSKYSGALDSILQEIQNPKPHKYSFNDDELFKYYADLETQNAKKANINAQGQAAALTGGYGNSYGAAAGAQAYQEALLPLYERGMQLAQFARDNYDKDQQRPYDQLAALQGMDESDYGRYRDTMSDWRQDEQNARDVYENERNFGYNEYVDALNNAMNIGKMEADSFRADQDEAYRRDTFQQSINEFNANNELDWANLQEKQRQFDADLSEEQRQYNQKIAMQYALAILEKGQIPSNELLVAAGLSLDDAKMLVAQVGSYGPGKPGDELDIGKYVALAAPAASQTTVDVDGKKVSIGGIGLNYEAEAKEAMNEAGSYPIGSDTRKILEDYAAQMSQASQAKDQSIEANRNGTTKGSATQAEYEAALRAAGLVTPNDENKGKKYKYKNGKLVEVE